MIDIEKQVVYWRDGAVEDWEVAQDLIKQGRVRHGLFFAHLTLEKALKAHVCQKTSDLAPKIHDLVRLATLAGLSLTQVQLDLLAVFNTFNLYGRYPDTFSASPSREQAQKYIEQAKEIYEWLKNQLSKA
jgi:HEPN domain-containing protein